MANHEVRVGVVEGKTVSGFVIEDNDHVTFFNIGNAPLHIVFPAGSPLCDSNKVPQTPIDVPVGGNTDKLRVCKGTTGKSFDYDATIEGAAPEDPIFIIEKASLFGSSMTSLLIGAGIGLIGGLVLASLLKSGKARTMA